MEEEVTMSKDSQGQKSQEWPASTYIYFLFIVMEKRRKTYLYYHNNVVTLVQVEHTTYILINIQYLIPRRGTWECIMLGCLYI